MNRAQIIYLLVVVAVFFLVNLVGAALITLIEPLNYLDAFYLTMSTSTTVGYGNVAPETDAGKMFLSFFQILPIGLFFYGIGLVF